MGLFDHLFKAKSPSGEDKVGEHASEGGTVAKPAEAAPRTPAPQRADPSAFLHPKNFVPRGAPGLTPAPRPSSAAASKSNERRTTSSGQPPAANEIVLTLGDVLSRIPSHYLKAGTHDAKRELRFKINDLSSDIARGRAAVPLSRIAQLAPEIFVRPISRDEDTEVRLPLQKLVEQIGLLRSQPKTPSMEKIVRPVTPAELSPFAGPARPGPTRQGGSTGVPFAVEAASGAAGPPIFLTEPAASQKSVELKPAAEQTRASVILGPPPVVETPAIAITSISSVDPVAHVGPAPDPASVHAVASVDPIAHVAPAPASAPIAPVAPAIASAPAISEVTQSVEPAAAAPEPAPAPAMPESSLPAADPHKIVIDWQVDRPAKAGGDLESSSPGVVAKPVTIDVVADAPRLAPVESPQLDSGEESIQLSLAAILRNCPREIVVGPLPHVDDSVRITLPFAPIDRQLIKGQVEVSALRFIAALPEVYQKYFIAKIGVKVPIPLEEVFQNLPTPTHTLTPAPPVPPPFVLAPAATAAVAASVASLPEKEEEEAPASSAGVEPPGIEAPVMFAEIPPSPQPQPAQTEPEAAPLADIEPPTDNVNTPTEAPASESPADSVTAPTEAPASESSADSVTAPTEAPAGEPQADITPPPLPISPAAESTPVTSGEPPPLVFHPPVFRPHFMAPPPIFAFNTSASASDSELAVKPESLSVLAGPAEGAPTAQPSTSEVVALETSAAPVPGAPTADGQPPPLPGATISGPLDTGDSLEMASEAAPTADLIALAAEHSAPDLVQFSSEPVPFADLAETLAHETTYASDLAEVVHVNKPYAEAEESHASAAAEQPQGLAEEHRPVPMIVGLASAAVAATIAEHAPLQFRDLAPVVEQPKPLEEAAAPAETHPAENPAEEVPVVAEQIASSVPEQTVPAVPEQIAPSVSEEPAHGPEASAEIVAEPEKAAPVPEIPEVPASEPPAAAIPVPPPLPLSPPRKLHVEPSHLEVLPPPALPLRRFDQDAVQALFMTEETLDLSKISRLAAGLPGVYACVIATRDQACTGGTLPEGFDLAALLGLAPRVGEAANRMPIGQLKHFTLYGDAYSVSFFERHGLSLCAVHRPRSFVPGVREKLVALADELSR